MKRFSMLQRALRSTGVLAVMLLLLSGTSLASPLSNSPGSGKSSGSFASKAIGAWPLWSQAHKVTAAERAALAVNDQLPLCITSATLPRCYSPRQFQAAYQASDAFKSGTTGKGRTIVIIDASASPSVQADLHLYDQLYGLKDPKLNVITPFGVPPDDTGVDVETALDVETAHAMAPDATIDLVLTGDTSQDQTAEAFFLDFLKPVQYAIDHNLGDTISISYGVGESCVSTSYLLKQHEVFAAAVAKKISIFVSAGDSGAANLSCAPDGTLFQAKSASIPASDTLVTSVGGTTLDADVKTGKYISETTWNEDARFFGATGGGFSSVFLRPNYQDDVPGTGQYRGLPDVAWDADPLTGVVIVVSNPSATNIIPIGGTSASAPAWAGIAALANQYAGKRLGFLNNAFYRILKSPSYAQGFHDITTGNNTVQVPANDGTFNRVTIEGYNAGPGWDAVTGVGTPKVKALLPLLKENSKPDDGVAATTAALSVW